MLQLVKNGATTHEPQTSKLRRLNHLLESKSWFAPWLIVAAGSVCTVPIALFGFVRGDQMHLFWAKHFSDQLWAGNLLPRWLLDMNSGLGSPTFYFYGPISYYITSFFFLVLPYHRYGWTQVGLSAALASVGSGLAAYLWLSERCSRRAACVAAIMYMWLPYHFRIDHLERFAFAEYWGFVWMPLVLYYVSRLFRGYMRGIVGLAIPYALLLMTHPPTALLFGALPLLYALVLAIDEKNYRPLSHVVAGVVLGALLASVYVVPALTTQSNASMGEMIVGDGSYVNNFLFVRLPGVPGPAQHYFQEWLATMTKLTLMTAGSFALIAFAGRFGPRARERLFWSIVVLVSLGMMHPFSTPVWKAIPLLQRIQFPWRFHIIVTLATTAMIAHAIDAIPSVQMRTWRSVAFGLAMLLIGFDGLRTLKKAAGVLLSKVQVPERTQVLDYPEYRPKWVPLEVYAPERVKELGAKSPLVEALSGDGRVWVSNWSLTGIQLGSDGSSDLQVRIRQFYYPTWTATLENGDYCGVSPSATDGLLVLSIPRGKHLINLKITPHGSGILGQRISLIAVVVTIFLLFSLRDPQRTVVSPSTLQTDVAG